jgi:hypothetical protein
MDITPVSVVAMSQSMTQNELATRVLKKTLDATSQEGAALAAMIDQTGGLGRNIDVKA